MNIPFVRPSIRRKEMNAVLTCLVSDSLGPGSIAKRFILEYCSYIGAQAGLAFREYGRAIEFIFSCLDIQAGDSVILSALLPSLYYNICLKWGCNPIILDVSDESPVISLAAFEEAIDSGAKVAIIPTSLGFVPDYQQISECGITIVEDLSEGLGSHDGERKCGSIGRYSISALEPENIITAGGGVIVTASNKKDASTLRKAAKEIVPELLLPDMNAALGLSQIGDIERYIQRRREIAAVYAQSLTSSRHRMLHQRGEAENIYFAFPLLVETGISDVIKYAQKKGLETLPAFSRSILAEHGNFLEAEKGRSFPKAMTFLQRCILFPSYPSLSNKDVDLIKKILSTLP